MKVNLITGDGPIDWIFADLLDRLYAGLPEVEFVRSAAPATDTVCDTLHFYRPQAALDIGDLSNAVLTCHGFGKRWRQGKVQPLQGEDDFAAHRRAAMTLVLNSIDRGILTQNGVAPSRIMMVPHPVDVDVFTLRPDHDPEGKLVIGRVGRPYGPCDDENDGEENKGRATLRATMRELRPKADRIKWLFLGDLWDEEVAIAEDYGFEVEFIRRDEAEYPTNYVKAYHQMDVFLVTSRSEGGPASLPEAMACGVWPICTPVGMCVDLVGTGYRGNLYAINRHDSAAELVRCKLGCRSSLDVARGGLRQKVSRWTWGRWARAHLDAYERAARATTA